MLDNTLLLHMSDNGEQHHSNSEEWAMLMVGGNNMGLKTDGRSVTYPASPRRPASPPARSPSCGAKTGRRRTFAARDSFDACDHFKTLKREAGSAAGARPWCRR